MDLLSAAVAVYVAEEEKTRDMARSLGICVNCYSRAWWAHMEDRNARLTLWAILHVWTVSKLALWRLWVWSRYSENCWAGQVTLKRDLLLSIGTADLYVRTHRQAGMGFGRAA